VSNSQKARPEKPSQRQHPRVIGVRIPDNTYAEMKQAAARENRTLAEIIRERLERGSISPTAA
jgi:hypothetical protein